jgi:glycosyltransferase involved in cell wall biosynthesis
VVVFVGSFLPWHRAEALVDALATAGIDRPWHLLLLGDGPRLPATLEAAARHGVAARVTSTGHLRPDAVGAHLRAADIAVLPATNAYGNPMKLVEYLAAGTAVVAPRQTTVTELCTHDRTAWLFTPDDPAALAAALRTVAHDDDLRRRLARTATAAAGALRWDRQAARLVAGMRAAAIGPGVPQNLGLRT